MKPIHLFLTLIFFLTACAPVTTALPTATIEPSATLIPTPTIVIASETPMATATEATPKEGDQITENGYTYTYTIIRAPDGSQDYAGWFRDLTVTPIPLWDMSVYVPDGKGGYMASQDIAPITVHIERNALGGNTIQSLSHADLPTGAVKNTNFLAVLSGRFMQNFGLSGDYTSLIYGLEGIQGAKPITYTYMYGTKTYTWQPSPTHGADIYIVNFDNTNGFNEWHDLPDKTFQPNQTVFRTIFWGTNAQGNISGAIATQDISKLDDSEIRLLALFHVASVLDGATTNVTGAGYGPFLQFLLGYAAKDTIPYIQIQK